MFTYRKIDRFVRFVNLMISDVTYLMDESLNDMTQIHAIQTEMKDEAAWAAKPQEYRREKEKSLRQLERMASGYCDLSRSTVELLQTFTAETREPFMLPEIVDKLAAMLDYNLDALVGPKCSELKVQNPDKYRFNPRNLLKEFLSIFINLGHEEAFIRAVAQDGRSYRKELFQKAMGVCSRVGLKSPQEIDEIGKFVERVEDMKLTIEAEEDLGEIPEEFTGRCTLSLTLIHPRLNLVVRSTHGDAYAGSRHLAIVKGSPRSRYYQGISAF
jgi:ubiquitin conjugation factor E4 B